MKIFHPNYHNSLNWLIPRSVFLPYWIAWLSLSLIDFFKIFMGKKTRHGTEPKLCIEAGLKGWGILEYKELYTSACEFLGAQNVNKLIISPQGRYYEQLKKFILETQPTHFLYSPRTGSQKWGSGLYQSFKISLLLHWYDIIPIASLTDLPFRLWRAQCAVITAKRGVVIAQMSPKKIHQIFPHSRLIGPSLMPFSIQTMTTLNSWKKHPSNDTSPDAVFTGSLYEPRTSILNKINGILKDKGHELRINGHELGTKRADDSEYWKAILDAPMIVTTADQIIERGRDWNWMLHFLFRYTEVLVCGRLLIAPRIPGIERFFTPGIHYVMYSTPEHAAEQIDYYMEHPKELEKIATQGKIRAQSLISARTYWMSIDTALGKNSFF